MRSGLPVRGRGGAVGRGRRRGAARGPARAAGPRCLTGEPARSEAIRMAANDTGLPVDRITEVSVLNPYSYH